jgi:hypothetical protein
MVAGPFQPWHKAQTDAVAVNGPSCCVSSVQLSTQATRSAVVTTASVAAITTAKSTRTWRV